MLVAVLVGLSAALYLGQARGTMWTVERRLHAGTMRIVRPPQGPPIELARPPWLDRAPSPLAYVQTRDVDGALLDRGPGLGSGEIPLSAAALAAVRRGSEWTEVARLDGERLLVLSVPVRERGAVTGIVQTAASLALLDDYLRGLRNSLVLVSILSGGLAFFVGWMVAGQALRPIDRIARAAQAIGSARDFSRRVDHDGPNDEVGRLAGAFNAMLVDLEAAFVSVETALDNQRRFVADASHELRTPLTTIRGNAELLRLEPPMEDLDRAAAVDDIVAETERLMGLVGDMLTLARAGAGPVLQCEPVPLAPLLDALQRHARGVDPDREMRFETGGTVLAIADREALKRVLANLVDNALHHTPTGAALTVTADREDDVVIVRVTDAGQGIDPEFLPRAFDRFERGNPTRTGPGTGLGLAIAKSLTEAQGGSIEVASRPGDGTTFTVRMPGA